MTVQFETMSDFFNMGGYAFFVWGSFIGTFICMFGILFQSVYVSKKIKQGVQKEAARAQRIMAARIARKQKQDDKAQRDSSSEQIKDKPSSAQSDSSAIDKSDTVLNKEVDNEPKT